MIILTCTVGLLFLSKFSIWKNLNWTLFMIAFSAILDSSLKLASKSLRRVSVGQGVKMSIVTVRFD